MGRWGSSVLIIYIYILYSWWLLRDRSIKLRSSDPVYVSHVKNYVFALYDVLKSHQSVLGGNILMLQIENEYGYNVEDVSWPRLL